MGGKTSTSSQQVSVPPQVLAQYQSVNQQAQQTAATPFQQYGGEFVAPVNAQQNAGIAGTNAAATEAQPYYDAATGVLGQAQAGTTGVNQAALGQTSASSAPLTGQQIGQYLSPYLNTVLGSESALINQNNQQQQAGQLGNAIMSGAFGSDRTGIAAANLAQQQELAGANVYSNILNTGYQSALGTAQGQQQIGLAGAQQMAGIGSTAYGEGANTASELGSLGTGAQTAGLTGAAQQIQAGTVQQQTQQAQDTALYNQFLQQQSYPFQVDEFLANIAEGTGSLSGSTTTTRQPGGFFSDERLKEDMEPVGKLFDGQTVYRYKLKGDPRSRIGVSAQETEKDHPEAVGLAKGYRWVDYGKATDDAANRGHFYSGGVAGSCEHERRAYAYGGGLDSVLQAQQQMYSGLGARRQQVGGQGGGTHQLAVASGSPSPGGGGSNTTQQVIGLGKDAYQAYKHFNKPTPTSSTPQASPGVSQTAAQAGLQPDTSPPSGLTTNFEMDPNAGTTTFYGGDSSGLGATGAGAGVGGGAETGADIGTLSAAGSTGAGTAAADAAAAGGVDAGLGAAAAGAGAGAAAGTVAGAAGTEAAALVAAEAAAAAAGTAVAVAAKRGGRIGYADGGLPYEGTAGAPYGDTSGSLNIPDTSGGHELKTAGPLQKEPTGLQKVAQLSNFENLGTNMASVFSNQALARGGVAGRGRFADGGAPDDTDVPTTDPDVAPTASDTGLGAAATGAREASTSHWWNKIKGSELAKPENLVPLLSAIGAMGTAPTRNFGVALAAGLGAGAQSYNQTQQALAGAAETRAKVEGQKISNQLNAAKTQAVKDALAGKNPIASAPTTPQVSPVQSSAQAGAATAETLDQKYRNRFFVSPYLPAETEAISRGNALAAATGDSHWADIAKAQRDQRYENQQAASRNQAQHEADALYETATRDPELNNRQAAEAAYNAIHQWTGDNYVTDAGGNKTNSRTGAPAIGIARQQLAPSGDIVTDAYGNQFQYDKQTNTLKPIGSGGVTTAYTGKPTSKAGIAPQTTSAPPTTFHQPVADQPHILQDVESTRANTDTVAPTNRNINQHLLELSRETSTGPATQSVQKLAAAIGLPSGSRYQQIDAYLNRQAAMSQGVMGVPHTNAGLEASKVATGTTEYTPEALQEKVKFADALNSGAMAYRQGLDKVIGTGPTPDLRNYQAYRSAWSRNFDPDIYRAEDAQRRGDTEELKAIRQRLGSRGMKMLQEKSANLRLLEEGKIPQ